MLEHIKEVTKHMWTLIGYVEAGPYLFLWILLPSFQGKWQFVYNHVSGLMLLIITGLYIMSFRLLGCVIAGLIVNSFISLLQNSGIWIILVKSLLKSSLFFFWIMLVLVALGSSLQAVGTWSLVQFKEYKHSHVLNLNPYSHGDISYQNYINNKFQSASKYKYLHIFGSWIIQLKLNCHMKMMHHQHHEYLRPLVHEKIGNLVFHWILLVRRMSHKMSLPCRDLLWRVTFGLPYKNNLTISLS